MGMIVEDFLTPKLFVIPVICSARHKDGNIRLVLQKFFGSVGGVIVDNQKMDGTEAAVMA
jgi:hypothetical protein